MQNLEAKFKLYDLDRARKQAEELGYRYQATLRQRDTFFRVATGKLKLREEDSAGAALIFYGREDSKGLRLSSYEIVAVPEPEKIRALLTGALGVLATVAKRRVLLTRGNVRFHLDTVDELGEFGEIEAVLAEARTSNAAASPSSNSSTRST